ncbi:M23 family metallopeptidase [Nocardia sp. alder85J]|nr:M23 family metallopeptidase [Nocardia sp. alder85J]MCX4093180.1 M23 family metallopeptidase [Nocardia sp. alder85J]
MAASAAMAAGALITTAQLAQAAPLSGYDADTVEPAASQPAEPVAQVAQAAPQAAEIAEAATDVTTDAAPFGLQNLPPEVAGPLSQAEQVIKSLQQQATPAATVRPVAGVMTSGYGGRWGAFHYGVDFADSIGTPIHSVESGTVIDAGPASGFGLWVRVHQDDGTTAVYGHVNEIMAQVGQRVNAGDVIATVGNRGDSTGPHLHLEIWDPDGTRIDPQPYLASRGVVLSQQQWGPGQE